MDGMLNVNTGITIVTFNEKTLTAEFSTHTKALLKDEMNAFLNIIYCCYIYLPNTQSISNYVIKIDRFHEILEWKY